MTEAAMATQQSRVRARSTADKHLRRRYAAERRFRLYGILALGLALSALVILLVSITWDAIGAFSQNVVRLEIDFDPEVLVPGVSLEDRGELRTALERANYGLLVKRSLRADFPEVESRGEKRELYGLVSAGAGYELRDRVLADPSLLGTTIALEVPLSSDADQLVKGNISREVAQGDRRVSDRQIGWLDTLERDGELSTVWNRTFFTAGDSREPELAGIWGALVGTLLTMFVTLALSFPIGVATAVYLEEFAPTNRWTDLIEVNINNLAAVPSIVFGLLGLAVFLNYFGMPRSAPLVGGVVLSLMTIPTIIIAARAALKAVPPSIREAALGVGASPMQTVLHHTLPLALPGILTGTIIGLARALGETAPLLMIGMVAFIVDIPSSFTSPSTALPVQIFLWADSPERGFVEKTSAAILVLLTFLVLMNLAAVLLRRRFEQKW